MKLNSYYVKMNVSMTILNMVVSNILKLINRSILVRHISLLYLGYNGLFSNIISVLSLTELGIGSMMIYALYKPYAQQDYGKVNSYLELYKKIYLYIFGAILSGGIVVSFFLPRLIRAEEFLPDTFLVYFLFLANSVIGYLFTYRRSILLVKEKGYYITTIQSIVAVITSLVNVLILVTTKNYILYLCNQILFTMVLNIVINYFANQEGQIFKMASNVPLSIQEKMSLKENIVGSFLSKVASVVVTGTDNILISTFINIKTVAIYSNYIILTGLINTLMSSFTQPIMASVGATLYQKETTRDSALELFEFHTFSIFVFNFIFSLVFMIQVNPFIALWVGDSFVLPLNVVVLLTFNVYLFNSRQTLFLFVNVYGLYRYEKLKAVLEAILNLGLSILFVFTFKLGLFGIILGTFLSTLCVPIVIEPIFVFRYGFGLSPLVYWKITIKYYLLFVASAMMVLGINHWIDFPKTWIGFVVTTLLNMGIVLALVSLFSFKNQNFKLFLDKFSLLKWFKKSRY